MDEVKTNATEVVEPVLSDNISNKKWKKILKITGYVVLFVLVAIVEFVVLVKIMFATGVIKMPIDRVILDVNENNDDKENVDGDLVADEKYDVYADDYITFKYPKGKEVEVESGIVRKDQFTDMEGVASIKIEGLLNLYAGPNGGVASLSYTEPNIFELGGHAGDSSTIMLKSPLYMRELANGLFLGAFRSEDIPNSATEFYEGDNNITNFFTSTGDKTYNGTLEYVLRENFDFINWEGIYYGIDDDSQRVIYADVLCEVDSEESFNSCADNIDAFISSVRRLK